MPGSVFLRLFSVLLLMIFATPSFVSATESEKQVWFVFSDNEIPPGSDAAWQPVVIPDSWNKTQNSRGGNGWYRIRIHFDKAPSEVWGLLLERINMNAAAFIGKHFLGDGGSFEEPVSRNWARPLMFSVDPAFLHAGDNDLYVRVFSYAQHAGGLQVYHVGALSDIQEKYQSAYNYYIVLSQVIAGVQTLLAVLLLMLWVGRKGDTEYLWLSAATLIGAMFPVNIFIQNIPVPQGLWLWVMQLSFGWFNWCMMMVAHRYLDMHRPQLEWWVSRFAVLGAIVLLLIPDNALIVSLVAWQVLFGLLNAYVLWISVAQWWRKRGMHRLGWMCAYMLLFATFMHDRVLIVMNQGFHFKMMFHLGVFVFVLFVFIMLGSRFIRALRMTEQHNLELSGKIDRIEAEEEQRRAVLDERQRIMRDLHDGLGNSLVSAMALSMDSQKNRPELQGVLREAMSEMRLIVGSSTTTDFDFEKALTLVRERARLTFLASGVEFHWQVEALLSLQRLHDSTAGMHVIRILQEALTNAIKHANASRIDVTGILHDDGLRLSVADNGRGMSHSSGGNGLKNMQKRAEEISASLSVQCDASGTTATLLLPLSSLSTS